MSIGIPEIILILVVVLLIFGGKRIPELARSLGRAKYEYKKAKETIEKEAKDLEKFVDAVAESAHDCNLACVFDFGGGCLPLA